MIYELSASRMLAPTIGSSIYVWTSVIGVIIAALSVGYTIGGRLADQRVLILDIPILLLGTAGCMINTLLFAPSVLSFLTETVGDPRLQGLFASLALFMPASLLLGIISPYLVRLHTASLATTGTSVASLSALNAIGGILGTFGAGFIFFSYMGVTLTLSLLCLGIAAASWIIKPKEMVTFRLLGTACLVLLTVTALAPTQASANTQQADTPSAHYEIIDSTRNGRPVRYLASGPNAAQSGIYLDNPDELVFTYTKKMAAVTSEVPHKKSILILGGGTFTQAQYLANTYPESTIDVVEIDPQLKDIAKEHFSYQNPKNVRIITADARAFLNTNTKQYDLIYVDIYSDASIPFSVATEEYAAKLNAALAPHGVVAANIIAGLSDACAPLLNGLHSTYTTKFSRSAYLPTEDIALQQRQNLIAVYSNESLSWLTIEQAARQPQTGKTFTDDFAPLEPLTRVCREQSR